MIVYANLLFVFVPSSKGKGLPTDLIGLMGFKGTLTIIQYIQKTDDEIYYKNYIRT